MINLPAEYLKCNMKRTTNNRRRSPRAIPSHLQIGNPAMG